MGEIGETKRSKGYGKPPWIFRGRQVEPFFIPIHFVLWIFVQLPPVITAFVLVAARCTSSTS